jgi:hypothetical protein
MHQKIASEWSPTSVYGSSASRMTFGIPADAQTGALMFDRPQARATRSSLLGSRVLMH